MNEETTFTIVPDERPRRARWPVFLVAALIIAGAAAAAGALTVGVREEAAALFAERVQIGDRFELVDGEILVSPGASSALGTLASPVEIGSTFGRAQTALLLDHFAYAITVRESGTATVGGGTFVVKAFLDGNQIGVVHLTQATQEPTAVEGARIVFDAGAELAPSSLYYVTVEALLQDAPTVAFTIEADPSGNQTWIGRGGTVDGATNPTLTVDAGTIVRLTGRTADGGSHNVGILGAGDTPLDPPGWSTTFTGNGAQATISWAAVAGSYTYRCQFHSTMSGSLVVEA